MKKTAADYAAMAVAPVLIFLMLSALASFLSTVMYRGQYSARMAYILMMFTMGAVATARLAIEKDRMYSLGYGGALGVATFVVLSRFVDNPIFSLLTIVVIAGLADVIVRDCTLIDETADSSDRGLLETGVRGLFAGGFGARRKNHQPGRTVLLLAIAALPLFGLGQFFLSGSAGAWAGAQKYLAWYLFAALSLLVTTSFLGMRRYLRQRGAEMPADVSVAWLGGGVAMVALILIVATLAPMPGSAIANFELPEFLTASAKTDQTASRRGWGGEGVGKQGDAPEKTPDDAAKVKDAEAEGDDPATQKGAKAGAAESGEKKEGPAGDQGGGEAKGAAKGKGESEKRGESKKQGEAPEGGGEEDRDDDQDREGAGQSEAESESKSESGERGRSGEQEDASGEQEDAPEGGEEDQDQDYDKDKEEVASERQRGSQRQEDLQRREERESGSESGESAPKPPTPPSSEAWMPAAGAIGLVIKSLILIGCLAVAGWFLVRHGTSIAAWWRGLFARGDAEEEVEDVTATAEEVQATPPRAFASFEDPFAVGSPPAESIVTTFAALEAFAGERGVRRDPGETPAEFQRRLIRQMPTLAHPSAAVVEAYNRLLYGGGMVPGEADLVAAKTLWREMLAG